MILRQDHGRSHLERDVLVHLEIVHIREDVGIDDLEEIQRRDGQERIVAVAPVGIAVIKGLVGGDGAGIAPGRIRGLQIDGAETLEILAAVGVVMEREAHRPEINRELPVLVVVDLAQARDEDREECRRAGMRIIIGPVVDHAVHQGSPIHHPGADETVTGGLLVAVGVEIDAGAERTAQGAVDDRELPGLAVVDLRAADEQGGAARHIADLEIVLMGQAAEIFLQGEEHLGGILVGGGVVVVLLGEGLAAELG